MNKIIIYLTNLTHVDEKGIPAIESIPLNIGFLAAYAKKIFEGEVEIELFNEHAELCEVVKRKKPHILAGSNYIWNSNLSYSYLAYFKKKYPEIITVMGGPKFSYSPQERKAFLKERVCLDFYISGEGELAFVDFIKACMKCENDIDKIKKQKIQGTHFLIEEELISGIIPERIKDLDAIPSPYLNGSLDKFLERGFTPILQSNRGCPFSCAFCCSSIDYYNKVNFFTAGRIREEIEYIARQVKSPSIHIHDDNFGMYKRDYDICKKFKEVQKKYNWPVFISAATGKNCKESILKCVELLGPTVMFSASVQSTDDKVLKNIRRDNIKMSETLRIQERLKEIGASSNSELILPLPGETKESHLEGIKRLMSMGIDSILPYTAMLLPASPLYEDKAFNKFEMLIKYRVIPKDFGIYEGSGVIEAEKVCVGTKDLSFQDYLFLRGFHFIIYCFYNGETFRELFQYLRSIGCEAYDFCFKLLSNINTAPEPVKKIFGQFLSDTKKELWDSEDGIYKHYSQGSNFSHLLNQEEGCNLLQKYYGLFSSTHFEPFLEYGFNIAKQMVNAEKKEYSAEIIQSIYSYVLNSRAKILELINENVILELPFDVHGWKQDKYIRPLSEYKRKIRLKLIQSERQKKIIEDYVNIYGDSEGGRGRIFTRIMPKVLFREILVEN